MQSLSWETLAMEIIKPRWYASPEKHGNHMNMEMIPRDRIATKE